MSVYTRNFQIHGLSDSQNKIIDLIKLFPSNIRVLELGASSGYMTKIINGLGYLVDVVDIDQQSLKNASKYAEKSYVGSLDDLSFLKSLPKKYDLILAADVLEHLVKSENVVKTLSCKNQKWIISLPNIACWKIRRQLFLKGDFEYQESGILDRTHLKFFTYFTFKKWLSKNGLDIEQIFLSEIDYPFRDSLLRLPFLGKILTIFLDKWMQNNFPNLSAAHMVCLAKTKS